MASRVERYGFLQQEHVLHPDGRQPRTGQGNGSADVAGMVQARCKHLLIVWPKHYLGDRPTLETTDFVSQVQSVTWSSFQGTCKGWRRQSH